MNRDSSSSLGEDDGGDEEDVHQAPARNLSASSKGSASAKKMRAVPRFCRDTEKIVIGRKSVLYVANFGGAPFGNYGWRTKHGYHETRVPNNFKVVTYKHERWWRCHVTVGVENESPMFRFCHVNDDGENVGFRNSEDQDALPPPAKNPTRAFANAYEAITKHKLEKWVNGALYVGISSEPMKAAFRRVHGDAMDPTRTVAAGSASNFAAVTMTTTKTASTDAATTIDKHQAMSWTAAMTPDEEEFFLNAMRSGVYEI